MIPKKGDKPSAKLAVGNGAVSGDYSMSPDGVPPSGSAVETGLERRYGYHSQSNPPVCR